MGLFSKKNETDTQTPPRNPNNLVTFRLVAIIYVSYLCINMVKLYIEGGPEAPSLTALIVGLVVLGGGVAFLAFITYREWKRTKAEYDQYMAELRAEAEAKRSLEEAEAAEDDALEDEADEYYEEPDEEEEEEEDFAEEAEASD